GGAWGREGGAEPQLPHQPLPVLTGLGGNEHRPRTACDGVAVRPEAEGELLHVVVRAARNPDHSVLSHIPESAPRRRGHTSRPRLSRLRIRAAVPHGFGHPPLPPA